MMLSTKVFSLTFAFMTLYLTASNAQQICRTDIKKLNSDNRYKANGDGTVTDLKTRLVWKQCIEGLSGTGGEIGRVTYFKWYETFGYASSVRYGGKTDWRVPNIKELSSLVDRACALPAINTKFFPGTMPHNIVWSSSVYRIYEPYAWVV